MHEQGLATLLEGAGYTSNIFECDYNNLIILWCVEAVKLVFFCTNDEVDPSSSL